MNGANPNNGVNNNLDNTSTNVGVVPNNGISQNSGVVPANSFNSGNATNTSSTNISDTSQIKILQNTSTNVINTQEIAAAAQNQNVQQLQQSQQVQQPQAEAVSPTTDKEEKYKNAQANYKPPSKFKTFLLIVFFIALVVFIIFLPEVQTLVAEYQPGGLNNSAEDIPTGKLVCTLTQTSSNLDKNIVREFYYTDKKLERSVFTTTIKGDPNEDENTLNSLSEKCNLIKENVESLSGISIKCEYNTGELIETEKFDYKAYNPEEVKASYTEAGGDITEYEYGYDIDKVMTSMRQGGFTCNKKK